MKQSEPDILTRPDGALVRIDQVKDGWVYFAAFKPGHTHGALLRMPEAVFREACEIEGMT